MSTGAIVAAASRRAERRLVEHLRDSRAIDPSSACPIPEQSRLGGRVLRRLIAAGAIREVGAGYYLDDAAYSAYRTRRVRTTGFIMLPVLVVSALVIWWACTR